jgi:hypothetical protein
MIFAARMPLPLLDILRCRTRCYTLRSAVPPLLIRLGLDGFLVGWICLLELCVVSFVSGRLDVWFGRFLLDAVTVRSCRRTFG